MSRTLSAMSRTMILGWIGVALVGAGFLQAASPQSSRSAPQVASPQRALVDRYCATCHNEKLKTAGLLLDKMDVENVPAGAEVWEKVIRKLRTGAMPPAGAPRPDKATYDSFATHLETTLDRAAEAKPNPGRPTMRRLNRAEYANAIRELLAIDTDVRSLLPPDQSAYGFTNIADVLSVTPVLMEKYLSTGKKISRLAVGDPAVRAFFEEYHSSQFLMQDDRMSEDLPFGSRGGIAIRHYFPLDGEYVIKITLQASRMSGQIRGLDEPHQLDIRLDGARIRLLTVGGKRKKSDGQEGVDYIPPPDPDEKLEVRFPAKAGARVVAVTFPRQSFVREGTLQALSSKPEALPRLAQRDIDVYAGGDPAVDSVAIGGPYNAKGTGDTPSRRKIFICRPTGRGDEEACARRILSTLAHRAYRGLGTDQDVQNLLSLYKSGQSKSGFEAGIEMALRGILTNPRFLFRVEREAANVAPDASYRISDLELASRLSFFLWSSMPDDELLNVAERGKLHDSTVLAQQVRRMLANPRATALVSNFAEEWLSVRNVPLAVPDLDAFPDFDWNLREAFEKETELFFESIVREDRSALDLLDADYTFLNERLARHYGIANIYGSQFRRVTLTNHEERRGLLGKGSILLVTSYANRTAPVLRGKWILENILGTPPPPPPPNVPPLKDSRETKILTMRERMEQHRANAVCASCHKLMDPLGFALDNFDAIGAWRTTEAHKTPIDASGVLADGTKFEGPAGLRQILMGHREQFVNTLTEKLLTYALGRGLEYYDAPAVRKVMRDAAVGDYRWSELILGIIKSTPFQMRRSQRS